MEKLNEIKQNEKKNSKILIFLNETHPATRHIKYKRIYLANVTNQL